MTEEDDYLDLVERDRDWWFTRAIAAVSIGGALVTAVSLIVGLIRDHSYLTAALLAALIVGLVAAFVLQRPRKPPTPLVKTKAFRAFGRLDEDQVWHRNDRVRDLISKTAAGGIVLVVGPSGAGKSTLLHRLLPRTLRAAHAAEPTVVKERENWPDPDDVRGSIVVLDQFEHALMALSWESHSLSRELDQLRIEVEQLARSARAVILSVREDWYVRLAFLQNLLPPLQQSTVLSRLGAHIESDVLDRFIRKLRGFLSDPAATRVQEELRDSAATPLELQAAGQLLELARHDPLLSDRNDLPNPGSAVEHLVALYVERSPNPPVVWKVLHALESVEGAGRRLTESQIRAATGEKRESIHQALRYLAERGLAIRHDSGYDLTHDSLLGPVQRLTARHLDPVERDSIQVAVSDPDSPPKLSDGSTRLPWVVMSLIAVMVAVRLLVPAHSVWYAASSLPLTKRTGGLDALYAAVAFPHVL